jgi:hypothetical protein
MGFDVHRHAHRRPVPGTCDLGDCSLREAIIAANASAGADVIVLGSGLTYTLSNGAPELPAALTEASGDLDIRDSLTINGNGSTVTAVGLTGANVDRVFHIAGASVVVTINSLTIKGGKPSGFLSLGAGLYVRDASVTLNNCTVTENTTAADATADDGGGIAVVGTFVAPAAMLAHLTLDHTTVSGNAGLNGGGIVCILCDLAVRNNSVIQANVATDTDGGGSGRRRRPMSPSRSRRSRATRSPVPWPRATAAACPCRPAPACRGWRSTAS